MAFCYGITHVCMEGYWTVYARHQNIGRSVCLCVRCCICAPFLLVGYKKEYFRYFLLLFRIKMLLPFYYYRSFMNITFFWLVFKLFNGMITNRRRAEVSSNAVTFGSLGIDFYPTNDGGYSSGVLLFIDG
jgi:hypothetical protein